MTYDSFVRPAINFSEFVVIYSLRLIPAALISARTNESRLSYLFFR